MSKNLDYNTDPVKHYVRYNGWITPFRVIKNYVDREFNSGNRPYRCKYLTFCAAQAVDVFMLERVRYLIRDEKTKRLTNVYFFENDEESFSIITKMIGSERQGFFGDFKQIILQQLSNTIDDPMFEPESEEEREKLRLMQVKRNLMDVFPFDVINLDFYGNFFPKQEERYSDSCIAFRNVLEYQKESKEYVCQRFLMFLTIYTPITIDKINQDSYQVLERTLYANMGHQDFRSAFIERFSHTNLENIDFHLKFIIGFVKQIIFKESYKLGWEPELKEIYCYDRTKPKTQEEYKMTTICVEFKRNDNLINEDFTGEIPAVVENQYLSQLRMVLQNKPVNVPRAEEIPSEVIDDLKGVVEFRNNFLKEIGIYNSEQFG